MLLPIAPCRSGQTVAEKLLVIAADVGATTTRLGCFEWERGRYALVKNADVKTKDHQDVPGLVRQFLEGMNMPDHICLAAAGPVIYGKVTITNIGLSLDQSDFERHFKCPVTFINDLEAAAYGLEVLTQKDTDIIQTGHPNQKGNAAIIAPGTGLGEAGLYFDGSCYHPFATEGGHADFAPRQQTDVLLYHHLHKKWGHVSWERLVSGPGIVSIYDFLMQEQGLDEPVWLKEKILTHDKAQIISEYYKDVPLCRETIDLFFRYLAREAANLVLKLKATGGLYISGGILPKLKPLLDKQVFIKNFCSAGRLEFLLRSVPVTIILNDKAALLGAAWFAMQMTTVKKETLLFPEFHP